MLDEKEKKRSYIKSSVTIPLIAQHQWTVLSKRYTAGVVASTGALLMDAMEPVQREILADIINGEIPFDPELIRRFAIQSLVALSKDKSRSLSEKPVKSQKSS